MEAMIDLHVLLDDDTVIVIDSVGCTVNLCLERAANIGSRGVFAMNSTPAEYYPPHRIKMITFENSEKPNACRRPAKHG